MLSKNDPIDCKSPTYGNVYVLDELNARLAAPPMMAVTKFGKRDMVNCVASAYKVGAVLCERQDEDALSNGLPQGTGQIA